MIMIKLKEITRTLERLAPLSFQESYDNSGLQVGDPEMEINGILITLDVTEEVVEEAAVSGFNLILSHHPVIFGGLKSLTGHTAAERIVLEAIKKGIAIYSGHTNFDAVMGGVNTALANRLGLQDQNWVAESRLGTSWLSQVGPPNLSAMDYHSDFPMLFAWARRISGARELS